MAFDLSAFRPRPENRLGVGSSLVDPQGGINPQPGAGMGMIAPPKPGGFLGPMVGAPTEMGGMASNFQTAMGPKPPMQNLGAVTPPPNTARPVTRPGSFRSANPRRRLGMF